MRARAFVGNQPASVPRSQNVDVLSAHETFSKVCRQETVAIYLLLNSQDGTPGPCLFQSFLDCDCLQNHSAPQTRNYNEIQVLEGCAIHPKVH